MELGQITVCGSAAPRCFCRLRRRKFNGRAFFCKNMDWNNV